MNTPFIIYGCVIAGYPCLEFAFMDGKIRAMKTDLANNILWVNVDDETDILKITTTQV